MNKGFISDKALFFIGFQEVAHDFISGKS